jgi:hypothetical protein
MPSKFKKLNGGRMVEIKSIHLQNGNLLIPSRHPENRKQMAWLEVEPGTSLYKRWLPVAVDESDPR